MEIYSVKRVACSKIGTKMYRQDVGMGWVDKCIYTLKKGDSVNDNSTSN